MRVETDGKFFSLDGERFRFRGVTYGTFEPRDVDGTRFPDRDRVKHDFAAIREAGFTTVRTYTVPPADVVDLAADWGLKLLVGVFYPDWRYLVGGDRSDRDRMIQSAREKVRGTARRFAGVDTILALSVGNEVPADAIRWFGTEAVADTISDLADVVREEDPDRLVTYANYPTAEYLPLDTLDFLTFNVFLERQSDFRRYLTRLHHLAGDRPLVLGEIGLDAGTTQHGEQQQAEVLDWQLSTAIERGVGGTCVFAWTDEWWVGDAAVEGWHFGLTDEDRRPRPALEVAERWNQRDVSDLDMDWPSMSVIVCAYNAADTLDECLTHACQLDYPELEVIVVDDGSTDATAEIAERHDRVRLVPIEHAGLSVARNAGIKAAEEDIVAYLDADAYPTPEWPYYLALGYDAPDVGGVGGPNVPPPEDGRAAQQVARAPGGPVHVLTSDDRAEHIPGCNMSFWRTEVLTEVGGFDPVYDAAGDDVDMCWRVLDRGWNIGFHPAALVWHHRRGDLPAYLRQQRGYGRAEALVEARHPDRFTSAGTAHWHGHLYDAAVPARGPHRVYRGLYGTAPFQSIYRSGGYLVDLVHQLGMPVAAVLLATAPLGLYRIGLALPAIAAMFFVLALGVVDVGRVRPPRQSPGAAMRFRLGVAVMNLLQPLARAWGRLRNGQQARRGAGERATLPGPLRQLDNGVLVLPHTSSRRDTTAAIVTSLLGAGLRVVPDSGWEDHDARILASLLVEGRLVTSGYPEDAVQVRVTRHLRPVHGTVVAAALGVTATAEPMLAAAAGLIVAADLAAGWWRTGRLVASTLRRDAS